MKNYPKQKLIPVSKIMNRHEFIAGFKDKKQNKSYRKEYDHWKTKKQEGYERGRLFAVIFKPTTYKVDYKPAEEAKNLMLKAYREKEIL